ncbi:MAG: Omp28-related outer membrane protein [Flavobacteriales bacterium]|nr:MAG: Omp28-related outer membrane protein [Flavobacteriales bacterium]
MNSFIRYSTILLMLIITLSCSKTESFFYEVVEPEIVTGLSIHSSYLRNQQVTFEVFDSEGNNITMDSNFIVDGTSIVGNQISYPEIGTHEVFAEYSIESTLYNSDTKTFNIVVPKTRVVLEDYTGTWCGYCPNVSHAIDEVRMITDDISVVAIHYGDEMTISTGIDLINEFNISGYPTARINRTTDWPYPYNSSQIESLIEADNSIAISIDSNTNWPLLQVQLRVVSEQDLSDHKIIAYLVEDNLIYDQTNYYNFDQNSYFYGMGNPIVDFIHNDVLRHSFTDAIGNPMENPTMALTDNFYNYSFEIDSEFSPENLGIVVMVVNQNNTAINSQFSTINSFQDFN